MIENIFTQKVIPNQIKLQFLEEEKKPKNQKNPEKSEIENNNNFALSKLNEAFEQLLIQNNPSVLEIYRFIINHLGYINDIENKFKVKILQDARLVQNVELSSCALELISYFAQDSVDLTKIVLQSLDYNCIHSYFKSNSMTYNITHLLTVILKFSRYAPYVLKETDVYRNLSVMHEPINENKNTQLTFNLSLIKSAILSFPEYDNFQTILDDFCTYLIKLVSEDFIPDPCYKLFCECLVQCILRTNPIITSKCIEKMFISGAFDFIVNLWTQSDIDLNLNICLIIYVSCIYHPNLVATRNFYYYIDYRFNCEYSSNNENENGNKSEIENKIRKIQYFFIYSCAILIGKDLKMQIPVFNGQLNLVDKIYDLLLNGSFNLKIAAMQFFWRSCLVKHSKFIPTYIKSHNIAPILIELFGQTDGLLLIGSYDDVVELLNKAEEKGDMKENPIIQQILNQECYDIIYHLAVENENEQIRNAAQLVLDKVFVDDKES
ncbi:hypothetical protein TRFO_16867 [Tritrichomonas foetus]|uniref:Uncharacterized protein n=1 Tax=Tritrichomonas foetus TaxID=1144522 RepID=A0A1J4KP89_9EUKA|nr:hypothetical protein TRFO_16867 [Tritrichomonas foetus]|eukprot:OHT13113.1 hypothetical protein TRFO_16867 [Tritrichomonas foetus]